MKLLRLWRQYDSIKAVVLLMLLAVFMLGYSIRAAGQYMTILQTPTSYLCTAASGFKTILPQLDQMESVQSYSLQKTAVLTEEDRTLRVTLLSPAYVFDCYGLEQSRAIYANRAAFGAFCGDTAAQYQQIRGALDGNRYDTELVQTDRIPEREAFAVLTVGAAELRDATELRVTMTEPDAAALERLGLRIVNPEVQLAAGYEQTMVLLRIRFGMLTVVLSCIAAAAFFRIYRQKTAANGV